MGGTIVGALIVGFVYCTSAIEGPKRTCATRDRPATERWVRSVPVEHINRVLNKNGVKNLVSDDNILCTASNGFQDIHVVLLVDPTKDDLFNNYREFSNVNTGNFKFTDRRLIDDADIQAIMHQDLPLHLRGIAPKAYVRFYEIYIEARGGQMTLGVAEDEAKPFLMIIYSTNW